MHNASPVQQQRGSSLSLLPLTVELSRCHQLAGLLQSIRRCSGNLGKAFCPVVLHVYNVDD
ncbi:hypothetical protein T4E_9859 [Trichinella pseudospiralis]|uniref:Uncharacterized protein n=1 Tax=Trichinella pseudospiralis TaxID=6337 RepID=A0A0V0XGB6_TRIPS|nr:hypothetical protein T4E_9859 [Trichinella pseudospiralis]